MNRKSLSPAKRIELARDLWGWEPHPTQREWLLDRHMVKVAACGRRWGKTEAAAVDVATYAIANNGSIQMIVAPTYDQSKLISNTVERLLLANDRIRPHVQVTKTPYPDIRYRDSRIMARTADEDGRNLRGHAADRVIVDEAAFVRDRVIEEVVGPMLADRNGQLVMISTPFGKNHFYRAFVSGQPSAAGSQHGSRITHHASRVRSFRFPSWENPHISREYIEYQRSVLTERQFKVEYEAEFVDDQNSVFPWADIQAAVCDTETRRWGDGETALAPACGHPSPRIGRGDGGEGIAGGACVAGIDWARYSDYTAVVVVQMENGRWSMANGEKSANQPSAIRHQPFAISHQPSAIPHQPSPIYRVVALDRFNRMDWHAQVERVADLLCRFGVRGIAADQTSTGDPVLEILRNTLWAERHLDAEIEGVVFTNQSKRELVDNLAIRLAHREVSFPYIEHLVRELQFYEYALTESGNIRTGARAGYHDDCVMALALALRIAPRYRFTNGFTTSGYVRDTARGW